MAERQKVLIVDDDANIAELIALYLAKELYETKIVGDGESALAVLSSFAPDLILLDLMLPGIDGYQVCRTIRNTSQVPIIMLSAKGEVFDKVLGLELGADDYITKPFSVRELMARVKANVRRAERMPQPVQAEPSQILELGRIRIDRNASVATKDGANLELTQREFELLTYLASNQGKVFSRQELMERVWNYAGYVGDVRGVDVAVRRLREKVEDNPATPRYIITRRGVGYLFERPEDE